MHFQTDYSKHRSVVRAIKRGQACSVVVVWMSFAINDERFAQVFYVGDSYGFLVVTDFESAEFIVDGVITLGLVAGTEHLTALEGAVRGASKLRDGVVPSALNDFAAEDADESRGAFGDDVF